MVISHATGSIRYAYMYMYIKAKSNQNLALNHIAQLPKTTDDLKHSSKTYQNNMFHIFSQQNIYLYN